MKHYETPYSQTTQTILDESSPLKLIITIEIIIIIIIKYN